MSDESQPSGEAARPSRRRRALRLGALLTIACALVVYLLVGTGSNGRRQSLIACIGGRAPAVREVPPRALGALREAVARVMPQRVGRLYEEGTVVGLDAWRDNEPAAPAAARTATRPAAYEMRWWAPNEDDIVADVFSFSTPRLAARFLAQAASARCRADAHRQVGAGPPQARNLTWVNPDAVAEADVYLQRGPRVYRVADVPSGQGAGTSRELDLTHALLTIDTLACLLPQAHCQRGSSRGVPT